MSDNIMSVKKMAIAFQVKHATDHRILVDICVKGLTISRVARRLMRDFAANKYKFDYPDETKLGAATRYKCVVVWLTTDEDIEILRQIKKQCFDVSKTMRRLLHQFKDAGFEFKEIEKPVI